MKATPFLVNLLLIFALPAPASIGQIVSDPLKVFAEEYRDQSSDSIPYFAEGNIVKIVHDFNNDGVDDIAISDTYLWGNAGGDWDMYLGLSVGKEDCRIS